MGTRRGFLGTAASAPAIAGALPPPGAGPKPTDTIDAGSRRQLLFDDFLLSPGGAEFADYPYNIRWALASVEKSPGTNLLTASEPGESSTAWVSVLRDGGKFRLWYNAGLKSGGGLVVSYAESEDGIEWRKPPVGAANNNVVFTGPPDAWSLELGNVFIDPAASPRERYKMIGPTWESRHIYPFENRPYVPEAGMLRGAFSADGIHWEPYPEMFLGRYTDSQNVATYDPSLGAYVGYIRGSGTYGGLAVGDRPVRAARRGRVVQRIESEDFRHWSTPETVLAPDFEDGLNVDFYNSAYSRYEGADHAHFLFPSAYHHHDGKFRVQVAVSRDNRAWLRPVRRTFIPLGAESSFDEFIISVAPGFVPLDGDRVALYYRSGNMPHGGTLAHLIPKDRKGVSGMGRVVLRRDRILGIEPVSGEAAFSTRPLISEGRRLLLNVEPLGPDAEVRVQVLGIGTRPAESAARGKYMADAPLNGMTFAECVPLTRDSLDGIAAWKNGANAGAWSGKPVRLQFRLRAMRIYGFQFVS
jgi:hypothetical protein